MTKEVLSAIANEHGLCLLGLPLNRLRSITRNDGEKFVILPMDKLEDRIYQSKIVPTFYAVFRWNEYAGFYVQVSKWYWRYGYAVRKMCQIGADL